MWVHVLTQFAAVCLQEIRELEDKLNFMTKRFDKADHAEWTGIIKKSPLW